MTPASISAADRPARCCSGSPIPALSGGSRSPSSYCAEVAPKGPNYAAIIDDVDDQELVQAGMAGDAGAVDQLLRRHYPRIFALCRRMMGSEADGADAAQDALIAMARGLAAGRFDGRSRFSTWAHRVATNSCLDELRRRRRRPDTVPELDLDSELPISALGGGLADEVSDRLHVDAALARLPADFRAAVVLRDLCGLDYADIARVLGIPPGTVRSRISRGRAALVPLLGNPDAPARRPTSTP